MMTLPLQLVVKALSGAGQPAKSASGEAETVSFDALLKALQQQTQKEQETNALALAALAPLAPAQPVLLPEPQPLEGHTQPVKRTAGKMSDAGTLPVTTAATQPASQPVKPADNSATPAVSPAAGTESAPPASSAAAPVVAQSMPPVEPTSEVVTPSAAQITLEVESPSVETALAAVSPPRAASRPRFTPKTTVQTAAETNSVANSAPQTAPVSAKASLKSTRAATNLVSTETASTESAPKTESAPRAVPVVEKPIQTTDVTLKTETQTVVSQPDSAETLPVADSVPATMLANEKPAKTEVVRQFAQPVLREPVSAPVGSQNLPRTNRVIAPSSPEIIMASTAARPATVQPVASSNPHAETQAVQSGAVQEAAETEVTPTQKQFVSTESAPKPAAQTSPNSDGQVERLFAQTVQPPVAREPVETEIAQPQKPPFTIKNASQAATRPATNLDEQVDGQFTPTESARLKVSPKPVDTEPIQSQKQPFAAQNASRLTAQPTNRPGEQVERQFAQTESVQPNAARKLVDVELALPQAQPAPVENAPKLAGQLETHPDDRQVERQFAQTEAVQPKVARQTAETEVALQLATQPATNLDEQVEMQLAPTEGVQAKADHQPTEAKVVRFETAPKNADSSAVQTPVKSVVENNASQTKSVVEPMPSSAEQVVAARVVTPQVKINPSDVENGSTTVQFDAPENVPENLNSKKLVSENTSTVEFIPTAKPTQAVAPAVTEKPARSEFTPAATEPVSTKPVQGVKFARQIEQSFETESSQPVVNLDGIESERVTDFSSGSGSGKVESGKSADVSQVEQPQLAQKLVSSSVFQSVDAPDRDSQTVETNSVFPVAEPAEGEIGSKLASQTVSKANLVEIEPVLPARQPVITETAPRMVSSLPGAEIRAIETESDSFLAQNMVAETAPKRVAASLKVESQAKAEAVFPEAQTVVTKITSKAETVPVVEVDALETESISYAAQTTVRQATLQTDLQPTAKTGLNENKPVALPTKPVSSETIPEAVALPDLKSAPIEINTKNGAEPIEIDVEVSVPQTFETEKTARPVAMPLAMEPISQTVTAQVEPEPEANVKVVTAPSTEVEMVPEAAARPLVDNKLVAQETTRPVLKPVAETASKAAPKTFAAGPNPNDEMPALEARPVELKARVLATQPVGTESVTEVNAPQVKAVEPLLREATRPVRPSVVETAPKAITKNAEANQTLEMEIPEIATKQVEAHVRALATPPTNAENVIEVNPSQVSAGNLIGTEPVRTAEQTEAAETALKLSAETIDPEPTLKAATPKVEIAPKVAATPVMSAGPLEKDAIRALQQPTSSEFAPKVNANPLETSPTAQAVVFETGTKPVELATRLLEKQPVVVIANAPVAVSLPVSAEKPAAMKPIRPVRQPVVDESAPKTAAQPFEAKAASQAMPDASVEPIEMKARDLAAQHPAVQYVATGTVEREPVLPLTTSKVEAAPITANAKVLATKSAEAENVPEGIVMPLGGNESNETNSVHATAKPVNKETEPKAAVRTIEIESALQAAPLEVNPKPPELEAETLPQQVEVEKVPEMVALPGGEAKPAETHTVRVVAQPMVLETAPKASVRTMASESALPVATPEVDAKLLELEAETLVPQQAEVEKVPEMVALPIGEAKPAETHTVRAVAQPVMVETASKVAFKPTQVEPVLNLPANEVENAAEVDPSVQLREPVKVETTLETPASPRHPVGKGLLRVTDKAETVDEPILKVTEKPSGTDVTAKPVLSKAELKPTEQESLRVATQPDGQNYSQVKTATAETVKIAEVTSSAKPENANLPAAREVEARRQVFEPKNAKVQVSQIADGQNVPATVGAASGSVIPLVGQSSAIAANESEKTETKSGHIQIKADKDVRAEKSTESTPVDRLGALNQPKETTPFKVEAKGLSAHVRPAEVVEQISRQLSAKIQGGATSMHLELHPQDLGAIEVQMVSSPQGVSVTFVAEQPATSRLLEAQMGQLRQALGEAGVQLSGLNIGQRGQPRQEGGGVFQQNMLAQQRNAAPVETAQAEPVAQGVRSANEVDYLI